MNKQLKLNFSFAVLAQLISLVVSFITNLILPKILGAEDYSYWQLFIFYATYVPCLALGINDGVYLRYGGRHEEDLNYQVIKSQYVVGLVYQFLLALLGGAVCLFEVKGDVRQKVIVLVMIYFMIYTAHNFLGYIFQAINETKIYSQSIIFNRLFYFIVQITLLFTGRTDVFFFIILYIFAYVLALLYLFFRIKDKFKGIKIKIKVGIEEAYVSIKTGISLMFSNVCSMLVVGGGKQIVDMRWGLLAFGKVSFSLTLINFILTFVSQISMILFPVLRRIDRKELKKHYASINYKLFVWLPCIYIIYLPARGILQMWLPEYVESIQYLSYILPICFFDARMNLLGNTFFKVLNRQIDLLKINLLTIGVILVWGVIAAYLYNSLLMVIIGIVIAIIFRSILTDYTICKELGIVQKRINVLDVILAGIFMVISNRFMEISSLLILIAIMGIRNRMVKNVV